MEIKKIAVDRWWIRLYDPEVEMQVGFFVDKDGLEDLHFHTGFELTNEEKENERD